MAKTPKPRKLKQDLMKGGTIAVGGIEGPTTVVTTPEGVRLGFRTASFGTRLGALLIDLMIMIAIPIVLVLVYFLLPLEHVNLDMAPDHPFRQLVNILIILTLFFARSGYFMFFEMGPRAATPGKRVMKIRVISHDGGHLTPAAVITRNALREVELFLPLTLSFQAMAGGGWLGLVAFLWALGLALLPLFNKAKARLGDFLGGTRVVHVPREALSFDLVEQAAVSSWLQFTPEQVAAYGEKELTVLEEVLRERRASTLQAVASRIKARIDWKGPKAEADMPSDESFLRAYYAALRAHLEGRMLMGRRRKDKFDPAT
ncbi:RDD family protein [Asticcacaulis sp. BYS171W]|uniref:RDD family protein n=1 Tax=Asticcacaulis aquaticus TaxID=2984212 RepID=A0ABT5HXV9_9CAUL|nr:RDD family protein [Asticcacaulis aquaticus]MDC7684858.1 RDD family protein [Asticcacaulis aquaticus]